MAKNGAVEKAISLVRTPTLARSLRARPLPRDVILVIRIAAGCSATTREAMTESGEPMHVLKEAAVFYLTQILLHPKADSYRTLGVSPDAPQEELRHNMAWLLRWLHPDLDNENSFHQYSRRVIRAWESVKTPERRAMYDRKRPLPASKTASSSRVPQGGHVRSLTSNPVVRSEKVMGGYRRHDIKSVLVVIVLVASTAWLVIAGPNLASLFNPLQGSLTAADGAWLDSVLGR